MTVIDLAVRIAHVAAALAVVLLVALVGRSAARAMRQPEVVGEITAGLLAGPAVIWTFGPAVFHALLPGHVLDVLSLLAEGAIVLFLVGLAHRLRVDDAGAISRVSIGALVPALGAGALLAAWVLFDADPAVRGTAPAAALVIMLAVSLAITAVPVLARILVERGMTDTAEGRLTLASAVVVDAAGWLLLSLAVGLGAGDLPAFLRSTAVLLAGAVLAVALRRLLRTEVAGALCARLPRAAAVVLAATAVAVAFSMQRLGLTAILGAVVVGLSAPTGTSSPWAAAAERVSRVGGRLVPVFFVVTGTTVLTTSFSAVSAGLTALAVALGVSAKLLGGYAGARWSGQDRWAALRVGVLMNTRGMTELVVLHVGHQAGILTPPLFLALVVLAVASTASTGPLLWAVERVRVGRATSQERKVPR